MQQILRCIKVSILNSDIYSSFQFNYGCLESTYKNEMQSDLKA
jgi:hypothetical protein